VKRVAGALAIALLSAGSAQAEVEPSAGYAAPRSAARASAVLDRAVVRFIAPETGGARFPRFVFERVLAFEARLEALADPDRAQGGEPYRERHVRAALERHIAETLLSSLRIEPEPSGAQMVRQTEAARAILMERVGGAAALKQAAVAEGVDDRELLSILRRQARASLYLDRMVTPMLRPSDAELKNVHASAPAPFRDRPFEEVSGALRRWYVARRLSTALGTFYQNARSRLEVTILER
jgi:hypothetical protein